MESGYDTITNNAASKVDTKNPEDKKMLPAPHRATGGSTLEAIDRPRPLFKTKTEQAQIRGLKEATTSNKVHMQEVCPREGARNDDDVWKPSKKRKVVPSEDHQMSRPNEMVAIGAVQPNREADSPDVGCREPVKEKRTGLVNMVNIQASGCSSFETNENRGKTCEPIPKVPDCRSFPDEDGDVEMMDLEDVIDLCGEEAQEELPGGDISCLKDGKPDVE